MIELSRGHVYLLCLCVLFAFLCVPLCVFSGGVHILGALLVVAAALVVGYRTLFAIIDRRLPLDLTPLIDIFHNLMGLPGSPSIANSADHSAFGPQLLDHGAEETRFQNERSTSGVMYEVDLFVQYIMKDFIVSWYASVSADEQFLREIQYALEDLSVALVSRVRKLDAQVLVRKALHVYHNYFAAYLAACEKAKEKPQTVNSKDEPGLSPEHYFTDWHFALESGQTEMQHLHNVVNVLLEVLLPADVLSCNLMRRLVVNLLACKVLHPMVNLLSDPVYMNQKISALASDSSHRTTEVTLRDPSPTDQTLAEVSDLQASSRCTNEVNEVSELEDWKDRTLQNTENESTLLPAEELLVSPDFKGLDDPFFDDSPCYSDDVTDAIWQRMADELPSKFLCDREQEFNEMVPEAAASPELKKKPLRLPLSKSIDKISDLFSGTISFDSISSNIAQYFKSASEDDKSSLHTQTPDNSCRQTSAEAALAEDCAPYENASLRPNEGDQRSELTSPEFHVKSVLERLIHMTTGPVLSEHAFSITNTVIGKDEEGKRNLPPLSVSESVESREAYMAEDFESKYSQEETSCDNTDNLKLCHSDSAKTPTLCPSQSETDDVALFTATFSNLVISGTEIIEDANSGSYVVYCIMYEVNFKNNDVIDAAENENFLSTLELQALSKICYVRRRFREFVTLHSRLEDDPKLRSLMKGIKGPNKWTMLPFNKLDKEAISERKQVLEQYLQTLSAKEDIAFSIHFKEFLAYGNDPSIAYVRKANDVGLPVPRIDKFLMKTMTGVFDKLKTALPSLPHDISPVEPFVNTQQKTSDRFLGFLNFNSGIADENTLRISFDFDLDRDYPLSVECYLSSFLNAFEINNEPADLAYDVAADIDAWCQRPCSPRECETIHTNFETSPMGTEDISNSRENIDCDKVIDDEIPLAGSIINFTVDAIQLKDTPLNCEHFVLMIKILFGRILERWMFELVSTYTCEKMFAKYLKVIRESLWPGGVFGAQASVPPSESDRIKIYTETLQALKNCFPGFISIILGKAQCDSGMKLVFDSLQHPKLLRHFIYHLMDLIVEALLIRSRSQSIVDKLSSL